MRNESSAEHAARAEVDAARRRLDALTDEWMADIAAGRTALLRDNAERVTSAALALGEARARLAEAQRNTAHHGAEDRALDRLLNGLGL